MRLIHSESGLEVGLFLRATEGESGLSIEKARLNMRPKFFDYLTSRWCLGREASCYRQSI